MKKSFVAVLALMASLTFANAQTTESTPAPAPAAAVEQQDEKIKIKAEELPEAVKKSLDSEDYRGWLVSAVYENKTKNRYEIEVKNGAEIKTLIFNKDGKKVD